MKALLLVLSCILSSLLFAQSCSTPEDLIFPINYKSIQYVASRIESIPFVDTAFNDSSYLVVHIISCKGKGRFEEYDLASNKKVRSGSFASSLGVLKEYATCIDAETGLELICIDIFYEPLKDGPWMYYNSEGYIQKIEQYEMGILR